MTFTLIVLGMVAAGLLVALGKGRRARGNRQRNIELGLQEEGDRGIGTVKP